MRRALFTALLVVAAIVAVAAAMGADEPGGDESPRYTVVLDNAFGLITGADVKVAGVRAGRVEGLDIRPSDARALVDISISKAGLGSFRSDVFCEVRPQSLIGEYFLDCLPGRSPRVLPSGSTIPVEQTATTIPADLVGNVLRRPYRERLGLILSELGVGLAARGEDLNETIRRAVPALRETDRALAVLARNRFVIQQLTRDADVTLGALADNGRELTRFVEEARDTAAVSADRRVALRATFRRLPRFLRELRPTLRLLESAAADQTPALRNLRASSPQLTAFLQRLGPFAEAARPAISSLGQAGVTGRRAAQAALPTVAELREFTRNTPETADNLAIILEHLDDRDFAVERDPDAAEQLGRPGEKLGYTGLEALLQYIFDQTLAINIFDRRGYLLKLNLLISECGRYTDADTARTDTERQSRCNQALGPSAPGINEPDPSGERADEQENDFGNGRRNSAALSPTPPAASPAARSGAGSAPTAPPTGAGTESAGASTALLDYLLAP